MRPFDWKKYLLVFFITGAIFATAFYIASSFDARRIEVIRATEEEISLDILSSETQFDLLGELSCADISEHSGLSEQLNTLASQLSVAEKNLGDEHPDVVSLKKRYTLLEIKDFILLQKVAKRCGQEPVYILYFYSNEGDCDDCRAAGETLTYLRDTYPELRVYAFDYNLDLAALQTLTAIKNIKPNLPSYVIGSRAPLYGLTSVDDILSAAPEIGRLSTSSPERSE